MPGFPVALVNVPAPISLGTKPKTLMSHHLAHWQNIPGVFRDNVNRHKINLRFGVTMPLTVRVTADSHGIHPPLLDRSSFHLHTPQFRPTLHDEIVTMDVSIGQRQGEAKAYRLMHKATSPSSPLRPGACPHCRGTTRTDFSSDARMRPRGASLDLR